MNPEVDIDRLAQGLRMSKSRVLDVLTAIENQTDLRFEKKTSWDDERFGGGNLPGTVDWSDDA